LRWVGIDEAGYGPNLGPLVMTAVVAEACIEGGRAVRPDRGLDFWGDLASTVDRAGGDPDRLWVDDSKTIYSGGNGRDRLQSTCMAAIHAASSSLPLSLGSLIEIVGAGTLEEVELARWLNEGDGAISVGRAISHRPQLAAMLERKPLRAGTGAWQVTRVRAVVVGPERFNAGLSNHGLKSAVHYEAFEKLLWWVWCLTIEGSSTRVVGDKHGGRHYYYGSLTQSFPDTWVDRGCEGPELSRYTLRDQSRRMEVRLMPRADANDGLVALASIVSKTIREFWMDIFNDYWCGRVPGLLPSAGYPNDSKRFRDAIETAAAELNCDPAMWWRVK
jgi:hypothetical protein